MDDFPELHEKQVQRVQQPKDALRGPKGGAGKSHSAVLQKVDFSRT